MVNTAHAWITRAVSWFCSACTCLGLDEDCMHVANTHFDYINSDYWINNDTTCIHGLPTETQPPSPPSREARTTGSSHWGFVFPQVDVCYIGILLHDTHRNSYLSAWALCTHALSSTCQWLLVEWSAKLHCFAVFMRWCCITNALLKPCKHVLCVMWCYTWVTLHNI